MLIHRGHPASRASFISIRFIFYYTAKHMYGKKRLFLQGAVQRVLDKTVYLVEQVNNNPCKSFNTPEDNSLNDLLFC